MWYLRVWVGISIFAAGLVLTTGCALLDEPNQGNPHPDESFVIVGSYDEVWGSAIRAMAQYRIRISNWDAGLLETESIRGENIWVPPHQRRNFSAGGRSYVIQVRILRGQSEGKARAHKLIVSKRIHLQRDFFSELEPLVSDGFEEKVIAYRIRREVVVDRALKRSLKNQTTTN